MMHALLDGWTAQILNRFSQDQIEGIHQPHEKALNIFEKKIYIEISGIEQLGYKNTI